MFDATTPNQQTLIQSGRFVVGLLLMTAIMMAVGIFLQIDRANLGSMTGFLGIVLQILPWSLRSLAPSKNLTSGSLIMINKALRILIADPQHFQRMKIERLFNGLEYYRVAPAQNLAELLTLVDYGCQPFDVVVINAELAAHSLDLRGFFLDNPQVRHALIYNEPSGPADTTSGVVRDNLQISHMALPGAQLIRDLMAVVDALRWKQERPSPQRAYA
ncbi:chemotaxis protein CheY [Pseudomonas fluorescens]|uniref:Chemotaxis protein CheY n=2 Tax=Pseudomonas fluorescens TaxID=294 RepID=A0A448DTV7_PSEFL|nr:chemotaxis protein CheY [Pseudomonas fluorescens]